MKTLIIYESKYGTAEKCTKILAEKLEGEVTLLNLSAPTFVQLDSFDTIIIGGSIYMGKIQKSIRDFCAANLDTLLQKRIGLFICGIAEKEVAYNELDTNYPKELLRASVIKEWFGGELVVSKLKGFDGFVIRKMFKLEDKSSLDAEKCERFAQKMNEASRP